VKFAMGSMVLPALTGRTSASSADLNSLVKQLITAAQPLEGRFDGAGRSAFDRFKQNADEIAAALDGSLRDILGGQIGMGRAFRHGDAESAVNAHRAAAAFTASRFNHR
jgi:uncharacterized protein YukE